MLSTFKSKSNLNCFVTVPLLLLIVPVILSPAMKSPLGLNTFNDSDTWFQPFLDTVAKTSLPSTLTTSSSIKDVLLNTGVNTAKSSFFMTLPKLLSIWYNPPVVPSPTNE